MKLPIILQRLEGAAIFVAALLIFIKFDYSLIWFLLFLLVPDISMIGYLWGNRAGAWIYNIGHSLVVPLTLGTFALLAEHLLSGGITLVWLAHIGMDRAFGYGLKSTQGFRHTHLGTIGAQALSGVTPFSKAKK